MTSTRRRPGTRARSSCTRNPDGACVTRLELDHPDVYADLDAYRAPFVELAAAMPASGVLALCADDPECLALRAATGAVVVTYGIEPGE